MYLKSVIIIIITFFKVTVKHRDKSTSECRVLLCMLKMEHPPCQSKLAQEEACLFRPSQFRYVCYVQYRKILLYPPFVKASLMADYASHQMVCSSDKWHVKSSRFEGWCISCTVPLYWHFFLLESKIAGSGLRMTDVLPNQYRQI